MSPRDYPGLSYWLETAGEPLTPRPGLGGDVTVDVAILGGGYSGLWTAYYLLRDHPGLEVAVVEAEICGCGASGRNGGWCSSRYPLHPATLEARYGAEMARETILAMYDTVDEVGRVCEAEGIAADFRMNGILSLARGEAQLAAVRMAQVAYARLGFGEGNRLLDEAAARDRVRVNGIKGALYTPRSAAVHPAKLVRGLARAVERLGGVIYEQTRVRRMRQGADAALETDRGLVRARRAVVAAGEAYLPRTPGFERALVPMSSSIVLTQPLSDAQWAEIGWAGGEGLGSQAHTVDYLTRTPDGRILYGSRGAPYLFGSATEGGEAAFERTSSEMRRQLTDWFPMLRDADFSHAWHGFLGVPRDWNPRVDFDADRRLGVLYGYTGRGVSTTNLAGRLLASLIVGRETPLARLPLAGHPARHWEPEPLRWLGVRYVQDAMKRMDAARDAGRPPPFDAPLAKRLSDQ
ncbi:FAD-binding oxidoreductase [Phenylobacterium sp. J367]|uniref:NAD(P)/FAD-dependent oxidoreductase n=1 Tax=Phenylobacterium sp. J367 TaxID=2898435 RepID=UPI002150F015|nr:FAD-dependent oxidoreductase [Phenylobacterium sp. J367]MCR5880668.1 FAD-binding oxidoreductase [Phenylobacterium sp. J367]